MANGCTGRDPYECSLSRILLTPLPKESINMPELGQSLRTSLLLVRRQISPLAWVEDIVQFLSDLL